MLILLALSLLQAEPAEPAQGQRVIVTGSRISDDRARLDECLRRRCPALEDIAASLRLAENLFVAGAYPEARSVLAGSIGRNRDEARHSPRAVAGLYRAHARVSIHLGEGEAYRRSSHRIVSALAEGLPQDALDLLMGRVEVGDMQISLGNARHAELSYQAVARQAGRAGNAQVEALARLRLAWLRHLIGDARGAQRQLQAIAADGTPERSAFGLAARVLLARIARAGGDHAATDQLLAELVRRGPQPGLTLIWAPSPTDSVPRARDPREPGLEGMSYAGFASRWIDLGFWVRPDGRVQDAEILRSEGSLGWTGPLLRSVAGRIYAPLEADPASPGIYRVERYTYTSLYQVPGRSRIRTRTGTPRIEQVDLSVDPPSEARPEP